MMWALTVPERIPLQVHSEIPPPRDRDRRRSAWGIRNHGQERPPPFLEGPVIADDGALYVVDVAWGRIIRVEPDGTPNEVLAYDGEPNGLALDHRGRLLIADYADGVLRADPRAGSRPEPILTRYGLERLRGVNDLVVTPDGSILFTDQGGTGLHDPTGKVLRLHPDGRLDLVLDGVPSPNGLAWQEDRRTLLLAVTRDNAVWRVPIEPDGLAHKVGRFVQLSGGVGPDGLALGPDGSLLIAHLGMGVVWVVDRLGCPAVALVSPRGLATTNVTVAPDGRVYVTEGETGTVLTALLPERLEPQVP